MLTSCDATVHYSYRNFNILFTKILVYVQNTHTVIIFVFLYEIITMMAKAVYKLSVVKKKFIETHDAFTQAYKTVAHLMGAIYYAKYAYSTLTVGNTDFTSAFVKIATFSRTKFEKKASNRKFKLAWTNDFLLSR